MRSREASTMFDSSVSFTAIIVTYNEERHLRECLNSLSFCDQILVFDLGSTDQSVTIAQEYGAEVIKHRWVPVVEQVWGNAVQESQNDWIIRADPDELFPKNLLGDILKTLKESDTISAVELPHQYYFRGSPLSTTIWGGLKYAAKVFHRDRVELKPEVHRGIKPKQDYEVVRILGTSSNAIQHFWIDSIRQLFEKHMRYVKQEGKSKFNSGERFTWSRLISEGYNALSKNLFEYNGIRGGLSSIFLSFFYSGYVIMSLLSLRKYQRYVTRHQKAQTNNK